MAIIEVNLLCASIGEAIALYTAEWKVYVEDVTQSWLATVLEEDGLACILIVRTGTVDEYWTSIQIGTAQSPGGAPPQLSIAQLVNSPGWNTTLYTVRMAGGSRDVGADFIANVDSLKRYLLEAWCGASIETQEEFEVKLLDDKVRAKGNRYLVYEGIEIYGCSSLLYMHDVPAPLNLVLPGELSNGATQGGSLIGPSTLQITGFLEQITQALTAISVQDVDVSFNNGQAVFSVRSRVNV